MRHSILSSVVTAAALGLVLASSAAAQTDHLQCHKVKDANKVTGAVIALTAGQAAFQVPENCELKGKAIKFCVPVHKDVVKLGDAPGSLIGPGQDLSANDYVCYKVKCPKYDIDDTLVTDQFGERNIEKIKFPKEICVPAVKGVATTTTTTLPPNVCPEGGSPEACLGYGQNVDCPTCVAPDQEATDMCNTAYGTLNCNDNQYNNACAGGVNASGCASVCCP